MKAKLTHFGLNIQMNKLNIIAKPGEYSNEYKKGTRDRLHI